MDYLSPSRKHIYDEMRNHPGRRYERSGNEVREMAATYQYKRETLDTAMADLAEKGLLSKERVGKKVLYYYTEAKAAAPRVRATANTLAEPGSYTTMYTRGENGSIFVSVPALPGCHSQGRTRDEARQNIREAIRGYLASLAYRGDTIPVEDSEQMEVAMSPIHETVANVVKDSGVLTLGQRDRDVFFEALRNPPEPNETLREAVAEYQRVITQA